VFAIMRGLGPGWLAAVVAVGAAILFTRALHEDGLADTADGLGPHGLDADRRLEIMRDSRNGTFGMLALALSVLIKVACLASFSSATGLVVLIAAHALSRAAIAYPLLAYSPVHADGLGSQVGKPTDNDVWLAIGIGAVLAFLLLLGKGFFVALLAPIAAWPPPGSPRAGSPSASAATPATRWAPSSSGGDRLPGGGGAVHQPVRPRHPERSEDLCGASGDRSLALRCGDDMKEEKSSHGDSRQDHRSDHALVVGPARAGAQPEARCYGQSDKDCDVTNHALFEHQARLLPKGAVWYASNLLRARKTAETWPATAATCASF
jgi:hypothetical protein